jgi:hypothetical protein
VDSSSDVTAYDSDFTDESDGNVDVEKVNQPAWQPKNNKHPPEYHRRQLGEFDEEEYAKEDYSSA